MQQRAERDNKRESIRNSLNLQLSSEGILMCRGCLQGRTPVYIPHGTVLAVMLIQCIHAKTIHEGVGLTMAAVREQYWIPKLRLLVKQVRRRCHTCRKHSAKPFQVPCPGKLPTSRSMVGVGVLKTVGVDFTTPIKYLAGPNK